MSFLHMKEVLIFLGVLTTLQAQEPQRCVTPVLWEGRSLERDAFLNYQSRSRISYDDMNQRVRKVSEFDFTDEKDFYDDLYLYKEGIQYSMNLRTRVCFKINITQPFRSVGIPTFAKFRGEAYIGSSVPNAGVLVSTWEGVPPDGGFYFGVWTVVDCIPVKDGFFSNITRFISTDFYDVTLGISDPNVFIPPTECTV